MTNGRNENELHLQPIDGSLFRSTFRALGGTNTIAFAFDSKDQAHSISKEIARWVWSFEKKYSRYDPESIVSKINSSAGKEPVCVDKQTAALLSFADTAHQQSKGLFDITSGVLRRAWDFRSGKTPTAEDLSALLPLIGWETVEWNTPEIRLPKEGMEVDFGGFGKEYAVDYSCSLLAELGVTHALVNYAGDVRALGAKPSGEAWNVGIIHPRKKNAVIGEVTLPQGALASSGDYERFMIVDGKRYCHILNPKTGWPVDDLQSVTVWAESCTGAGVLATTAMLFGEQQGEKMLKRNEVKFLLVNSDGAVKQS